MPVVQMVGQAVFGHVIAKFSWIGLNHIFLPMVLCLAHESSANNDSEVKHSGQSDPGNNEVRWILTDLTTRNDCDQLLSVVLL